MNSIARCILSLVVPLLGVAGICTAEPLATDAATLSHFSFNGAEGGKILGLKGGSADLLDGVTLDQGKYGQGVHFNGVNGKAQLRFPKMLRVGGDESCTIEAWVMVKKAGANQPIYSLPPYFELEVRNVSGAVSFNLSSDDGAKTVRCTGKKNIVDGAWHKVTGIRDAAQKKVRVYIDGELDAEVDDTTAGLGVIIGETAFLGSNASGSETFGGVIDDLRISNVARPMKQIAAERPPEGQPVTLENQHVRFIFGVSGSSVSLKSFVDMRSGVEFIDQSTTGGNLWQAQMRSADRQILVLNETAGKLTVTNTKPQGGKGLSFKWDAIAVAGKAAAATVEVTVDLPDDSRFADWRINIDNTSDTHGLWTAVFPRVTNLAKLADDGTDVLAIPGGNGGGAGQGQVHQDPFKTYTHAFLRTYPCYYQSMQFNAYYNNKAGLYLATHDGKMNLKGFLVQPQTRSNSASTVSYEVYQYPADAGLAGTDLKQDYPHVVGTFSGDWYDACKIYRKWALQQVWASAGPLEKRDDISPFIKNGAYWMVGTFEWLPSDKPLLRGKFRKMPFEEAEKNVRQLDVERSIELVRKAREFFDFPLLLWTNEWFDGGGDVGPPRYIAQGNLKEYMRRIHTDFNDVYVSGHMQMRRFSIQLPEYTDEVKKSIEGQPDGQLSLEAPDAYDKGDQIAHPCWHTEYWKNFWVNKAKWIGNRTNLDGFHVDELASGTTFELQCFDPSHGHPIGGGSFYADSRRAQTKLLREAARTVRPGFAIHHEALSEIFIDVADLGEVCTAPVDTNLPMWEAVYHDYSLVMGRRIHPWMDRRTFPLDGKEKYGDNEIDQFVASFAQTLIWGNQPGWTRLDVLEYSPKVAQYIKDSMHVRYRNMKYLNFGEYIRPLKLETPQEMIKTIWTTCDKPEHILPAIMDSVWKASDGTIGVVLANTTGDDRTIHYSYDLSENGGNMGKWKVLRTDGPEPVEVGIINGDSFERTDAVPARSVIVLSFVPVK